HSATIAARMQVAAPTWSPEKAYGNAVGSLSRHSTSSREALATAISSSASGGTDRNPSTVLIMVGKKIMIAATAMIVIRPVPSSRVSSGAIAMIGNVRTTRANGTSTWDATRDQAISTAATTAAALPRR